MAGVLTTNLVLQKTKLDNMKHVRKLNVCGVNLNDIRVLRDAVHVELLALSVNEIEDLEPLSACTNLRELYLRKNLITDIHQVLHLCRHPYLSSLTLQENPIAKDPNYRRFCIAALPALVRFDDQDISRQERLEAEDTFPDLCEIIPPPPLCGNTTASCNTSYASPPRPSTAYQQDAAGSPVGDGRLSTGVSRRSSGMAESQRLARKFDDLAASLDERPVGGGRVTHIKRHGGGVSRSSTYNGEGFQMEAAVAAPRGNEHDLREDGVVAAVKLLIDGLSPAALLEIRRYIDASAKH